MTAVKVLIKCMNEYFLVRIFTAENWVVVMHLSQESILQILRLRFELTPDHHVSTCFVRSKDALGDVELLGRYVFVGGRLAFRNLTGKWLRSSINV